MGPHSSTKEDVEKLCCARYQVCFRLTSVHRSLGPHKVTPQRDNLGAAGSTGAASPGEDQSPSPGEGALLAACAGLHSNLKEWQHTFMGMWLVEVLM